MMTYAIHESNFDRLVKKLNRIKNKCEKYGCEFHFAEVGEEFRELEDEYGNKHTARYILVEAEGKAIVNNWVFVASLDHTEKGNIINRVNDIEVPERYYNGEPVCEHCGNKRTRKTFIVMNTETGEFKQVGRNCLADFTHGLSAEGVAQYIAAFNELIQGEKPTGGWSTCRLYMHTEEYLEYVAETIAHFGYQKSGDGQSTASRAVDYWIAVNTNRHTPKNRARLLREMESVGFNHNSDKAVNDTKAALEWLEAQEENNNYIHNLKVACSLEYISRETGIVASLFPTWNRDLEYQAKVKAEAESAAGSEHIGEIGERITIQIAEATPVTGWHTQFGYVSIWKMIDKEGNVFTWKTSNTIKEKTTQITGTVKAHNEFRGTKQTELTRCKQA